MGNRRKNMFAAMQCMFVYLEKKGRWLWWIVSTRDRRLLFASTQICNRRRRKKAGTGCVYIPYIATTATS